ncbi:MAG: hypothetical protein RLZ98_2478 [Pseudomonadota bacterium]|jgi:acetyltransferase
MTVRNLKYIFEPKSVAVIGASNRIGSVGRTVMHNLLEGGFDGPIMPVNPSWEQVAGVLAYKSIDELPRPAELAVICTSARTVPHLISELGARGTKAAIVLSAGFEVLEKEDGRDWKKETLMAARPHLLRVVGPNCVGVLAPHAGLNASFAHVPALSGKLAFVSQSGALATAVLDWANSRGIGFSHFVSIGNAWDVDFGDLLDHLGSDAKTKAILLYIESVTGARKFMSAARAASRNKPVIVIKAGRHAEGAAAAATHTGALAGADDVYDAAIRRAGMLRVDEIEDLFNAAELLGREFSVRGDRLAIVTNGGGAGVMATDALAGRRAGRLAKLSDATIARLDRVLPDNWSRSNPVDIIGDAPVARYLDTLDVLQASDACDAILLLQAPTAIVPSSEIAEAVEARLAGYRHPVLSCWLGGASANAARGIFARSNHATFDTPEDAIGAFSNLVQFKQNQALLMEAPPAVPEAFEPDTKTAREVIDCALREGRTSLSEPEAKAILAAYQIPTVETRIASDEAEAVSAAEAIGYPVALKILSQDISHKSDVGGVVLDIENAGQLAASLAAMRKRIAALKPDARIAGFTVQRMARRSGSFELILGAKTDPVFGPVVLFGEGGTAVELTRDRAVGLPPINMALAGRLIDETKISRLLGGYRNRPGADLDAVRFCIVKVAQLVTDLPEVVQMDINPLLADGNGILALDARIELASAESNGMARLAIRPYPKHLTETQVMNGLSVTVRPIRPEDEAQHRTFLQSTDRRDIYLRFFGMIRHFEHSQLARLTQIDYDREMAFIAEIEGPDGPCTIASVRMVFDPDIVEGEFAIIVHSKYQGLGLGKRLMEKVIDYSRQRGALRIIGQVLRENARMLRLTRELGFAQTSAGEPDSVEVTLELK